MQEKTLQITLDNEARTLPVDTPISALLPKQVRPGSVEAPLAAVYNNRLVSLSYRLRSGGSLRWVTLADRAGWDVYRRSAALMLYEAARRLDPGLRLVLHQTHADGLYYEVEWRPDQRQKALPALPALCKALGAELQKLSQEDLPFEVWGMSVEEARDLFRARQSEDKLTLLSIRWETSVQVVSCGSFVDLFFYPLAASTGAIRSFRVAPYGSGLLLRVPVRGSAKVHGRARVGRKLFDVHNASRAWSHALGVSHLGDLNRLCVSGGIEDLIRIAEGGHEKQIAGIADAIAARRPNVRLVLIAGPSSSGKTTFVKRLGVQLRVNRKKPVALSVDDFFLAREDTPKDDEGRYDFECLEAINLELFNETLAALLERGEAKVPCYDFRLGKPTPQDTWTTVRLAPDEVLLIEGIHALNARLTPVVPNQRKFHIFISAITQLSIDDHNRIFTSDGRLLRRIVRDRRYRGYSAAQTLGRWPLVRRGEMRHIFPFEERADALFNSALVYEHAVLRNYVQRYLLEIDERDDAFQEAYRLLGYLHRVVPILPDAVPQNSILREFIGNSAFDTGH